jgi:hypothetical protein
LEERDWVKEDVCHDMRRKLEMEKNPADPRLPTIHQIAALEKKAFQPHPVRSS